MDGPKRDLSQDELDSALARGRAFRDAVYGAPAAKEGEPEATGCPVCGLKDCWWWKSDSVHPEHSVRNVVFVKNEGVLAEALGISPATITRCERLVEHAVKKNWPLRRLVEFANCMGLDDAEWTVFMYTLGWWDHARRADEP